MNTRSLPPSNTPCDIQVEVDAYLPWSGGSRTYYHNLYSRLVDNYGCNVIVNTTHCEGEAAFDELWTTSRLHITRHDQRLPDWGWKRAPLLAKKTIRALASSSYNAPAAMHCGDLFPQAFAGSTIRRLTGTPLLIFVHGDEISQTEGRKLQPHIRNLIYRTADALVAANTYAYRELSRILGSTERLTLITPGVDLDSFYPAPAPSWLKSKYHLGSGPILATVGRLVRKKGHDTILSCLPQVVKEFPTLRYLIVGDGPERSRLQELTASLGLTEQVVFTGNVPHEQLGDYYRAADIFCMVNQMDATGDVETFGMVFLEANATGKPVIGGRSGGTSQSILDGETGFLCEPEQPAQAASYILLLLRDVALRERIGMAGFQRVRQDFDWNSRAAQLFEIHNRMVRTLRQPYRRGAFS